MGVWRPCTILACLPHAPGSRRQRDVRMDEGGHSARQHEAFRPLWTGGAQRGAGEQTRRRTTVGCECATACHRCALLYTTNFKLSTIPTTPTSSPPYQQHQQAQHHNTNLSTIPTSSAPQHQSQYHTNTLSTIPTTPILASRQHHQPQPQHALMSPETGLQIGYGS